MRLDRNTIILIVVSILVIGAGLILSNQPTSAPTETQEAVERVPMFPELTAETVVSITVQDKSGEVESTTTLERSAQAIWSIAETNTALEGEIDQQQVSTALASIVGMEAINSFEAEDDLSPFGLDAPIYTITLRNTTDQEITLYVGNENPGGTSYYVQRADQQDMILLSSTKIAVDNVASFGAEPPFASTPTPPPSAVLNLPGPIFGDVSPFTVTGLEVRDATDDSFILVEVDENGNWVVTDGTNVDETQETDTTVTITVISSIPTLAATDGFESEDLESLGLAEPKYVITTTLIDGTSRTLKVGDVDPSGERYYTLVDDFEQVAVMPMAAVDAFVELIAEPPYIIPAESTADPEATVDPESTAEASSVEATDEAEIQETEEAEVEETPEATEEADEEIEAEAESVEATEEAEETPEATAEATDEATEEADEDE